MSDADSSYRDAEAFSAGMEALAEASGHGLGHAIDATAAAYRALAHFEAVPTRRGQATAHLLIGELAMFGDELGEARDHLERAVELFAQVGNVIGGAHGRTELGHLHTRLGDLAAAGGHFEEAARLAEATDDLRLQGAAHRNLGSWARRNGKGAQALTEYRRAAAIFEALEDDAGLASVHLSLGNLCSAAGEVGAAMTAYAEAARGFRAARDRLGEANAERFYADAARRADDLAGAKTHYEQALELYLELDEHLGQSQVRRALGELAASAGDEGAARDQLTEAIELFRRIGDPISLVTAVDGLAQTYADKEDPLGALRAMSWGVAEARAAARWTVGKELRTRTAAAIADLESRALALALELGEPVLAGGLIEDGVAGLIGLLPVLLAAPPSGDPRTERLRARIRDLARQLAAASEEASSELDAQRLAGSGAADGGQDDSPKGKGDDPPAEPRTGLRSGSGGPRSARRAELIAELETLLGPRAKEVVAPERIDYPSRIEVLRREGAVMQYAYPNGIGGGKSLYVVWASPEQRPTLTQSVLSDAAAARLLLLSGAGLAHGETAPGPGDNTPGTTRRNPPPATAPEHGGVPHARGLGLEERDTDRAAADRMRRLARETMSLWAALDRDARAEAVVGEIAAALFPDGLADYLAGTVDTATGVPTRALVVPGPRLWNLPWAGLVAARDGRRLIDLARVSLAPSLSCLADSADGSLASQWDGASNRMRRAAYRVDAWIPEGDVGAVEGTGGERAMVGAMFGREALATTPAEFLARLSEVDAAIASVHGNMGAGLSHGVSLTPDVTLSAADLIGLDLPEVLVIGACWSARVDANGEPFALPLIAHARGAGHIIGGVYPLPDAPPFPTARLLTQLYPALLGTDPATALWLAQHEAHDAGAAPHMWAGVTHTTTRLA
ncbi:MAG: CHAT domain-containing protein [Bifidobacteriaceae bacterium]|jgi:tetratricopeptide (TPR) repeat protein|nr:CHAT domain-containing protein [Bifidobacteriaceae bacterium]